MSRRLLAGVGTITDPWGRLKVPGYAGSAQGQGLITLLNNILRTMVALAGVWALINLITAGYGFMSAEGNPEKMTQAWSKIWQTLLGLLIVAGSYGLAALFGYLIYQDATAILSPKIYGP